METTSKKIELRQKHIYSIFVLAIVLIVGLIVFLTQDKTIPQPAVIKNQFDVPTNDIKPENIRLAQIEKVNDVLSDRLQSIEKSVITLKEEKTLIEAENRQLAQETQTFQEKIQALEDELKNKAVSREYIAPEPSNLLTGPPPTNLKVWEPSETSTDRNVLFEIPAGTVVKAVIVGGVDCNVGVQRPTGLNMMLLRPLDNGKLPRNVRVALKGTVILCNAFGERSSERVFVRAERMSKIERNGSFIETEVSAYITGEDGKEGIRGVMVDRSNLAMTRAVAASILEGIGQNIQGVLNNQTIQKLAEANRPSKTILDVDMFRNSAMQGANTAVNKLAEYYIKLAEQTQPVIQIDTGRVVNLIFTKSVKIGEMDLKKKFDKERELKLKEMRNG